MSSNDVVLLRRIYLFSKLRGNIECETRTNIATSIEILSKFMESFLLLVQGQEKYLNINPFFSIRPFSTPGNFEKILQISKNSRAIK